MAAIRATGLIGIARIGSGGQAELGYEVRGATGHGVGVPLGWTTVRMVSMALPLLGRLRRQKLNWDGWGPQWA
jgi:hypothetical protein